MVPADPSLEEGGESGVCHVSSYPPCASPGPLPTVPTLLRAQRLTCMECIPQQPQEAVEIRKKEEGGLGGGSCAPPGKLLSFCEAQFPHL